MGWLYLNFIDWTFTKSILYFWSKYSATFFWDLNNNGPSSLCQSISLFLLVLVRFPFTLGPASNSTSPHIPNYILTQTISFQIRPTRPTRFINPSISGSSSSPFFSLTGIFFPLAGLHAWLGMREGSCSLFFFFLHCWRSFNNDATLLLLFFFLKNSS